MRSLYRYSQLKNSFSPNIVVEQEEYILKNYLLQLSAEDIYYMTSLYPAYEIQQKIQDKKDNSVFQKAFEQSINDLN